MSSFISLYFFIFLPVVVLFNFVIPRKFRYIWLFVTSICFYGSIDLGSTIVLALVILLTYGAALLLEKSDEGKRKLVLTGSLIVTIGTLVVFKYLGFIVGTFKGLTGGDASDSAIKLLAVTGISFYMLKAIGYLIDVYREDIQAERNVVKYALFVSFFPQILSGPIERAGKMLPQFTYPLTVDYDRLRDGLFQMLWGYFLKMVIADRLSIYVAGVYSNPAGAVGFTAFMATIFYTFEIYCDFAGYSHIAIGMARILGIDVMKNFESPYLSGSIAEFWRRWHISLSTWFRDYLYIPLGGNRKGTVRKYLNVLIVFAVSGLWHGAAWTFVFWGFLHGVYQVIGYLLRPVRDFLVDTFKVERRAFSHRLIKIVVTFLLVNYAWVFFRASSMAQAFAVIKNSLVFTPWQIMDQSLYSYGLTRLDFLVAILGIMLVILVDIANYYGIIVREKIMSQGIWVRYLIGLVGVLIILILGIWGPGYDAGSFIYQQF